MKELEEQEEEEEEVELDDEFDDDETPFFSFFLPFPPPSSIPGHLNSSAPFGGLQADKTPAAGKKPASGLSA